MKTINTLYALLCVMLLTALPATAQNTTDNKNKAIIETTDGSQELNTEDIQVIRFDGGKITIVQPWGDTTFDRTLRTLSFLRPNPGTLRLTATTSIGTDNSQSGPQRVQAIDTDGKLKATWADGDVVYVYADESSTTNIGTLTPKSYGEKTATLSGEINADGLSNGKTLYFSTKDRATLDLSKQDGTVESLFYFTATAPVTIDGGNASISDLTFERPIAIVKFTLKDKATSNAISATSLNVVADGTAYSVTPTTATDFLFVGIPAIGGKTVSLTAFDGSKAYTYSKSNVSFSNNSYYAINVKMTEDAMLATPLTFEAKEAYARVTFTKAETKQNLKIEYSKNGGAWTTYTEPIILTNVGDKVSFRGDNDTYATYGYSSKFSCSADCYIYGNIMSLIDKNDFATKTTLSANYTFSSLFYNNIYIYNHSTKALLLPATTLTQSCYSSMFACTNLTEVPALPATTLANSCYNGMFESCTRLTTAPALPATKLANSCYCKMFQSCTNLTIAPALPATTLANSCYNSMFGHCNNLATAPALPATTLAPYCYTNMFVYCTNLATTPELPATTLAPYCYNQMFYGCTNLNSVTCLATDISADYCTSNWLSGVATTGTFNKAASADWSVKTGANGIPSGWTEINEGVLPGKFTVNASGGKVSFSMGSLQYQANSTGATSAPYTGVWRFAGHQYDNIGADNKNISESYTGWIDLFGWGTSGYAHRTSDYQPWSHTKTNATFTSYNSLTKNLYDEDDKADWGYNAISNGGNTENSGWRTPKNDEWGYLFNTRTTTSGIRYAKATVNGVTGVILLPDDWDESYYVLNKTNTANALWSSNVITLSDWGSKLEYHGAVFFPTSGNRDGNNAPTSGFVNIWSSDYDDDTNAHCVFIPEDRCSPTDHAYRSTGLIVRLVKNNISEGSISYTTSEVNKLSVDAAFTNPLTKVGDGTVTYARSDGDNICTVNENTGEVTLNGTAGSCTITATVADSPFFTYATNTASYTLTVTAATIDLAKVSADITISNGWTVTGTLADIRKISIADGATVTLSGVTISRSSSDISNYPWAGITCEGNATIILADGSENTVTGNYGDFPGIYVPVDETLTIRGSSGSLTVSNDGWGAGIGGGTQIDCGNIVIEGGNITVTSRGLGAGIGSGGKARCGTISISGGTINATSASYGAGIGSGWGDYNYNDGSGGSFCAGISITGGHVTAQGGNGGAGIGSGKYEKGKDDSYCGDISITGGTVIATGGNHGAGIGSGYYTSCGDIYISNTVTSVIAIAGQDAIYSIGADEPGVCGTVTIEDGANVQY